MATSETVELGSNVEQARAFDAGTWVRPATSGEACAPTSAPTSPSYLRARLDDCTVKASDGALKRFYEIGEMLAAEFQTQWQDFVAL